MVIVELKPREIYVAHTVAAYREAQSREGGFQDRHGYSGCSVYDGIVGAIGELALAKYLDVFWSGGEIGHSLPDVGDVDVRSTTKRNTGLIVRQNNLDDRPIALAVVDPSTLDRVWLAGWCLGWEAKLDCYRTNFGNGRLECWSVPIEKLINIKELKNRGTSI